MALQALHSFKSQSLQWIVPLQKCRCNSRQVEAFQARVSQVPARADQVRLAPCETVLTVDLRLSKSLLSPSAIDQKGGPQAANRHKPGRSQGSCQKRDILPATRRLMLT
jgi:hypothetical protein